MASAVANQLLRALRVDAGDDIFDALVTSGREGVCVLRWLRKGVGMFRESAPEARVGSFARDRLLAPGTLDEHDHAPVDLEPGG